MFGVLVLFLSACATNEQLALTKYGEKLLDTKKIDYRLGNVKYVDASEVESIEAGYRSAEEISKYMKRIIRQYLVEQGKTSNGGEIVNLDVNVKYKRIFAWGDKDSIASVSFDGAVFMKGEDGDVGVLKVDYTVSDNSIFGNFKAMFAADNRESEDIYFNTNAKAVVDSLP